MHVDWYVSVQYLDGLHPYFELVVRIALMVSFEKKNWPLDVSTEWLEGMTGDYICPSVNYSFVLTTSCLAEHEQPNNQKQMEQDIQ